MKMKRTIAGLMIAGLGLSFHSSAFAQSSDSSALLVLPGIWKAEVTSVNFKDQFSQKMGKQLTCVEQSITSEKALIPPFFEKYISAGCVFTPVRDLSGVSAVNTKEKHYAADITCGAMTGGVQIAVIDDGHILANVIMKGEINGVMVGENMKTKLEWEWAAPSCK